MHPLVAGNYGIGERTYVAVIDIQDILEFCGFNHKFTGIAKYPAVTRDLSMVVPKHVLAGQIEDVLEQRGGKILESYQSSISTRVHRSNLDTSPWLILWYSVIMKDS